MSSSTAASPLVAQFAELETARQILLLAVDSLQAQLSPVERETAVSLFSGLSVSIAVVMDGVPEAVAPAEFVGLMLAVLAAESEAANDGD